MVRLIFSLSLVIGVASLAFGQSDPQQSPAAEQTNHNQKSKPGAGREIASGAGSVGTGSAKAAGNVAKGGGKAAADLVTLHPIDAAGAAGKGAAEAGKDVTVGTVRGTGKVAKGIGGIFKKIF